MMDELLTKTQRGRSFHPLSRLPLRTCEVPGVIRSRRGTYPQPDVVL